MKNVYEGFIINENMEIKIDNISIISSNELVNAINFANEALRHLHQETSKFDINIFEALGMRNLSGLVGEYFSNSVSRFSKGLLTPNLHQDGYPDLLLIDTNEKKKYFESLYVINNNKIYPKSKQLFSPFKYGGVEVKATCGSTPPAKIVPKPLIGEQRINLLTGFDWKAHHRETNNLLALLWDFIDEVPTIVACFFNNELSELDWGNIVQPIEGGGRTTSVSIMNSAGVKKMCVNWIAVIDNEVYINALSNVKWIGYNVG